MTQVVRGRLDPASHAPTAGERFDRLVDRHGVVVEQILSAANSTPARYLQDHDEFVVVINGGAVLDVDGERLELGPGDWVLLPGDVPHTVERTDQGTSWLAIHLPRNSPSHEL